MNKLRKYCLPKDDPNKLQFEIYPLRNHLLENAEHTQKAHIHDFYQIIWFEHGCGKHYVDFREYDVSDNTIFFISKGQVHQFDQTIQDGCVIHFDESFLDTHKNFTDVFLKHTFFHSYEKDPFFRLTTSRCNELHHIVQLMFQEIAHSDRFAHSLYLKVLLQLFLIEVQRQGVRKELYESTIDSASNFLFMSFRKLVEENFHCFHTVASYAEMLDISTRTLTNCTRKICNQTPLALINGRLVLEARRLLSYSEKNVDEIGYMLGFEDSSYFSKFFKKHTGILPKDFRKTGK